MEENTEKFEEAPQADMVTFRKEDLFPIWDKCSSVMNANLRARMAANLYTATAACRILNGLNIECDTSSAMQEIPSVLCKWDISEVYVNECKISVRYAFGDYKYFVPKKQERYGLLGDLFMFVRIADDLSTAKLEGFLPAKNINKANSDSDNYYFHTNELKPLNDIKKFFSIKRPLEDIETRKTERIKIVQYLDGSLEDKLAFFKLLASSEYLRKEMLKFEKSEKIFTEISAKEDLIKQEIEKDVANISKLADAFIQSRDKILASSDSETFKLECARANLEKLFNSSSTEENYADDIHNKTTEEVMDTLLTPSSSLIQDERLPMSAVLRAFRFFGFLVFITLFAGVLFCYFNYTKYNQSQIFTHLKQNVADWVSIVKKK